MLRNLILFTYILPIFSNSYSETSLKEDLFLNYNNDVFPSGNNTKIDLSMGIAFRAFNHIDQIDGTLTANIWLRHWWTDELLKWDPNNYNNITSVILFTDPEKGRAIWTPDIYLYNTAEQPMSQLDYSHAIVDFTGYVIWSRPGIIESTCYFDLVDFPYDQQKCEFKFGSWSYNGNQLNLVLIEDSIDISNFQKNEAWNLVEHKAKLNVNIYECCPEPYQDITFEVLIRRKPGYYEYNIIFPTFATAFLIIFSLFIPWDQGERISYSVTVMLSIIVFLLILSENLPKTDTQPLLSRMLIGLTLFSLFVVLINVLIGYLHSYKDKKLHFLKNIIRIIRCQKSNCFNKNDDYNVRGKNENGDESSNLDISSIGSDESNDQSIDENIDENIDEDVYILNSESLPSYDNLNTINRRNINTSLVTANNNNRDTEQNNEKESKYEKCSLIAEYLERILTAAFTITFIVFCIVLFDKRPSYYK